jgi:hypothetical protein
MPSLTDPVVTAKPAILGHFKAGIYEKVINVKADVVAVLN